MSDARPVPETLAGWTGEGVTVALLDTGVAGGHPHVGEVIESVAVRQGEGGEVVVEACAGDPSGHGTACAGVIRWIAPEASLISVRVLDRDGTAAGDLLAAGITWAARRGGIDIISVSCGTPLPRHRRALEHACAEAVDRGLLIVAAWGDEANPSAPASLPGVIGVGALEQPGGSAMPEGDITKELPLFVAGEEGGPCLRAPGWPRPIPGQGPGANFRGSSFSAARVAGYCALLRQTRPSISDRECQERLKAEALKARGCGAGQILGEVLPREVPVPSLRPRGAGRQPV